MATQIDELPSYGTLVRQDWAQDIRLRKWYAIALLGGLGLQLIVVNTGLFLYAEWGVDWDVPPSVINTWLGATVVQVVAVVLVVTRYLFPRRDTQP